MFKTSIKALVNNLGFSQNNIQGKEISLSLLRNELLAGITVSLALVPEAVAFAFVAGVAPLVGLYAAFIVGLITAIFGGRPGMISGATGALAVVMVSLVSVHGEQYLFATVVLMGIIQLIAGVLKLGKFIRMVPQPVMLGFVNGLAIVIGLAQLSQFKVENSNGVFVWMEGEVLFHSLGLVGLTMYIIWMTPKITKLIPGPLIAIVVISVIVFYTNIKIPLVGDLASISGGLPKFKIPLVPIEMETFLIILPYAIILSLIGLIESLLTLNLVGEITGKQGGASKECLAQGSANFVTGFFGGMGGCAMIGQSMINVRSGGRTRLSGITAAVFLLIFILYASSLIELIPLAALTGVMFMVVIGTFAWHSIKLLRIVPKSDALVIILVTFVTVIADLAVAVIVGVIFSALVYAWNAASIIRAVQRKSNSETGAKVYEIEGPLFFGSTQSFKEIFNIKDDPKLVILDFAKSRVVDQSALKAIEDIAIRYAKSNRKIKLRHLSKDCHKLLTNAGQLIVDSDNDPEYGIAVDYNVKLGVING
ncbi:MAG: SulP family inorganic anion transporter [Alphaproteobacteria bacterium]